MQVGVVEGELTPLALALLEQWPRIVDKTHVLEGAELTLSPAQRKASLMMVGAALALFCTAAGEPSIATSTSSMWDCSHSWWPPTA